MLVRFGDPDIGPPLVTCDADAFLGAVNALKPGGGGLDCPELSQLALLQAIGVSDEDATIFLFTDADSKDRSLAGFVAAEAKAKRAKINPLIFGSCGSPTPPPVDQGQQFGNGLEMYQRIYSSTTALLDPTYVRNAQETGGQFFLLAESDTSKTFGLVKPQLPGNLVPVFLVRGTLAASSREFTVPIDSAAVSATFSVSMERMNAVTINMPSGTAVSSSSPGVTVSNLLAGQVVTVAAPERGVWRVQISGDGDFSVSASVNSSLALSRFEFVELTGRPAHEGLFRIPGQPLAGIAQLALANVTGGYQTAAFRLIAENGDTLQAIEMNRGNQDAADEDYVGTITPPSVPFLVAVSGSDSQGKAYQRLLPKLFRVQTMEIRPQSLPARIYPGGKSELGYKVKNLGPAGVFRLGVSSGGGLGSAMSPEVITLETGASADVIVQITVPPDVQEGGLVVITATISNPDSDAATNTVTQKLTTQPNSAPSAQTLSLATMANTPLEFMLGGADEDGDPLSYEVSNNPQHGLLIGTAPTLTYVPAPGYIGDDAFTYVVSDGGKKSAGTTVSIAVNRQEGCGGCSTTSELGWLAYGMILLALRVSRSTQSGGRP